MAMAGRIRILLLSAYDAHSHRRWRQGLVGAFPEWDWTVLTLPPRNFAWRVRGNSLTWSFAERRTLEQPYDALVATSMTDLSALKGMVPELAPVPAMVYCHENQFAYPLRPLAQAQIEAKLASLYALVAADRVVFNSDYNRRSFLDGAQDLLQRMPDAVPPGVMAHIAGKSCCIAVPLEAHWFAGRAAPVVADGPFTIVWNHRWEYDKAPERLFAALLQMQQAGADFRVHVVGHRFRRQPGVFAEMYPLLQGHIGEWGTVTADADYHRLLRQSHVVLSTALHEFQGLALLEAVAAGCVPLAPDRLAYPEFVPEDCRYPSTPEDPAAEAGAIAGSLLGLYARYQQGALPRAPDVSHLSWGRLRRSYQAEITALTVQGQ